MIELIRFVVTQYPLERVWTSIGCAPKPEELHVCRWNRIRYGSLSALSCFQSCMQLANQLWRPINLEHLFLSLVAIGVPWVMWFGCYRESLPTEARFRDLQRGADCRVAGPEELSLFINTQIRGYLYNFLRLGFLIGFSNSLHGVTLILPRFGASYSSAQAVSRGRQDVDYYDGSR
jgi:hypothetical protein